MLDIMYIDRNNFVMNVYTKDIHGIYLVHLQSKYLFNVCPKISSTQKIVGIYPQAWIIHEPNMLPLIVLINIYGIYLVYA